MSDDELRKDELPKDDLPKLNWESAHVREETLTVELAGERPEHWSEVFLQTVRLLPRGEWGDVECEEEKVTVTGVRAGVEDRLAHFLESVVQQANATFAAAEDKGDEQREESDGSAEDDEEDTDDELTARFRAFGQ